MRKLFFSLGLLVCCTLTYAQKLALDWGAEIKLKKGSTDLEIVAADETGLYFSEAKLGITKYKLVMADYGSIYRLIKYDKNYNEVYEKVYKKEMKDKDFHSFQTLGSDLYMFVTDYEDKNMTIYGARIDKSNGELTSDFIQVGRYFVSSFDAFKLKITPVQDGNAFLLASDVSTNEKFNLGINLVDKKLKKLANTTLTMDFRVKFYTLEGLEMTKNNQLVLLGREFMFVKKPEHPRGGTMDFKQYLLTVFNIKGEKLRDLVIDGEGHHVVNGKMLQDPTGGFIVAGFYSNATDKKTLNGFFYHRFDAEAANVLQSSYKEIDTKMMGKKFTIETDDDLDMSAAEKRMIRAAERSGVASTSPNEMQIKSMDLDPADQSILITAELSNHSYYQYSFMSTKGRKTHEIYKNRHFDIVVINADREGNLRWVNVIPKSQLETLSSSETENQNFFNFALYFSEGNAYPWYSSFASIKRGNNLYLILNDHVNQLTNPRYGAQVTTIHNFRKYSNIYGITIDIATGKMTRHLIAPNTDDAILMPRHAFRSGEQLIIPSWRQHSYAKTQLKFARVEVK